jgi:hypothetical protein
VIRKPTDVLAETARNLANDLFAGGCENAVEGRSETACLAVAERKGRNKRTGERTAFRSYDDSAMCLPCSAYWHAERAAQLLEHRKIDEARSEAVRS